MYLHIVFNIYHVLFYGISYRRKVKKISVKSNKKKIPVQHICIPIAHERGGIIRYMSPHEALAKPNERFEYEVLALLIIESGTATYVIDNKIIEIPPLSAVWCFPEQERTLCNRTTDFKMWVIEFTQEFLQQTCTEQHDDILKQKHEEFLHRRLPVNEFQFMRRIFAELLNIGEPCPEGFFGKEGENDLFNAGLHYILQHCWRIFRIKKNEFQYTELHPAVSKAVRFLSVEGNESSSVEELAKHCGLSASRIVPLFHKEVGMTITEFRNRRKLDRFFTIYSPKGPHNLMSCALDAGFGSYAQFYRIFTSIMGCSPRDHYT